MISITEYQWQQIKNYLPKDLANNALIFEIERQAQTNAQQTHGEICSAHICDYCVKYRSDACRAALCGMDYPMFMGRKLSPC